jgi:hypothetical protein
MPDEITWEPGWFRDPTGRHDHRWWDGAAWTTHVADAGVAGRDPLAIPASEGAAAAAPRGARVAPTRPGTTDPVAVIALPVAVLSVPLSLLPLIGLVPAIAGVVLGVVARSRVRRNGSRGDGLAIGALVTAIVALVVGAVVTIVTFTLLSNGGGGLSEAFRDYAACLEVSSQAECRMLLEQSLARMLG